MKGAKILMILIGVGLVFILFNVLKPGQQNSEQRIAYRESSEQNTSRRADDPTYSQEVKRLSILFNDAERKFKNEIDEQKRRNEELLKKIDSMERNAAQSATSKVDDITESMAKELAEIKNQLKQTVAEKDELLESFSNQLSEISEQAKDAKESTAKLIEEKLEQFNFNNDDKDNTDKNTSGIDDILSGGEDSGGSTDNNDSSNEDSTSILDSDSIKPYKVKRDASDEASSGSDSSSIDTDKDVADGIFNMIQNNIAVGPFKDVEASTKDGDQQTIFPVYTLPMNTYLSDSVLITPMVGKVPVEGSIDSPFQFKIIIGKENLAANGHKIPGVSEMIMSGFAIGNREQSCTQGIITSMTYIFEDGRIVEHGSNQTSNNVNTTNKLGYIVDKWGKPCIRGEYINNAGQYVKSRGAAAFLEGLAAAYAQSQVTYDDNDDGGYSAYVDGNTYNFAFANGVSGTASEIADYVRERQAEAFDIVFVPQAVTVGIFIETQIPIDYDATARKVNYIGQSKGVSYD